MMAWIRLSLVVRRFSTRFPFIATRAAVVSDEVLASQAGLDVLRRGGNATDAVLAMSACMQVLQPYTTGVGGDCFALYYDAREKKVHCVDGSGRSPAALTLEMVQSRSSGEGSIPKQRPGLYATVPGATKAWFHMASRFGSGKLSLSELFEPAVQYAERGFAMDHIKQRIWRIRLEMLQRIPGGHFFLDKDCQIPKLGQIIINRPLAALFKSLAREGPRLVYEGTVARAIVNAVHKAGGVLSVDDLAEHLASAEPMEVEPLSTMYRGDVAVHTTSLPTQGVVLLEALNILEQFSLRGLLQDADNFDHLLIEALRHSAADGLRHVADVASGGSVQEMLSEERATEIREHVILDRRIENVYPEGVPPPGLSGTTFMAAADDAGNVCALIGSLSIGCAVVEEHGFTVQARGTGFNLEAGHPNCFGPHKKPYHSLMPVMVTDARSNDFLCTLGTMGGLPQPAILAQILLNMVELGLDPQRALARPRFLLGSGLRMHPDGPLTVEPDFPEEVLHSLTRKGHVVRNERADGWRDFPGIANVLAKSEKLWIREDIGGRSNSGAIWAGTDPRYSGVALGY